MTNQDYPAYRKELADELKQKRNKFDNRIPGLKKLGRKVGSSLAKTLLDEQKNTYTYQDAEVNKYRSLLEYDDSSETPELKNKFTGNFDKKVADLLIRNGYAETVGKNLKRFTGLDMKTARLFMSAGRDGYPEYVVDNKEMFRGKLSQEEANKEIIKLLITSGSGGISYADYLVMRKDKFPGMDQYIADQLMEHAGCGFLADNIEKFEGLDLLDIADKMINKYNAGYGVAYNLEKFPGLDHRDTAIQLLKTKQYQSLARNIAKFIGVDPAKLHEKAQELLTEKELQEYDAILSGEKPEKKIFVQF